MTRRKRPDPLPRETSDELRARLRRFALLTREQALRPATVPFPENVTVLAGPLRKVDARGNEVTDDSGHDWGSKSETKKE
ncbi:MULTISPECIES: hypothetical protein [Paraburkholderia]|uniref:hypothetical protein n=1 Tax=Paraburkholderia TaxID=1822464 RepID=UPI0013A69B5A|nr:MULTISPECIES: hypothetical protein [Paraburkholderia]MDH6147236.1 hypothetical protein [Paraburkholderia sp. WSM4179]